MRTIDEVHVAPLGHEHDRILEPVAKHGADVVYLLEPEEHRADLSDYRERLTREIEAEGAGVRTREVALQDLYDVMAVVTTLAAAHGDDVVRVNVSSGSKIAAIGCAIACMATEATPYYVHPEEYVPPLDEEPLTRGMAADEVLPTYPIETITRDQVAILEYLSETNTEAYTAKKKDLIEFAEAEGLSFMRDADPANDKAKFALLNSNVVDPLVEDGYVSVEAVGRTKQLTLTDTGENVLHAFRHKLEYGDEESD